MYEFSTATNLLTKMREKNNNDVTNYNNDVTNYNKVVTNCNKGVTNRNKLFLQVIFEHGR